jgi:serine O-acetyltransferase
LALIRAIDLGDDAMLDNLRTDLSRCGGSPSAILRELISTPGMWAVIGYRLRRWIATTRMPRVFRWFLSVPATLLQMLIEATTCIQLPGSCSIGPGLYIPHTGFIVVGAKSTIGRHCTITQGVTIGHGGGRGKSLSECPVIGDRVYIGPGAILIGPITIGDDALIGAGAVVTRSVPARGVAVGNPARIISRDGSFELIAYPGMDRDPSRLSSLVESRRTGAASNDSVIAVLNGTSS